jgi:hypothetical protein
LLSWRKGLKAHYFLETIATNK